MDTMQNVWQIRMTPKPSRKQLEVRAAAERAYRSRRAAQRRAGHDLTDWVLELSLKDSGRRRTMLDTPNVLV